MKKMLVIATVAIIALCGQAATVDWTTDWSYSKNADKGIDTFDDSGSFSYWVVLLAQDLKHWLAQLVASLKPTMINT